MLSLIRYAATLFLYFFSVEPKRLIAVYPLNTNTKGKDISSNNLPARLSGVVPARGPDGIPGSSLFFKGKPNSYVTFPNRGPLDTKDAITMLAWINPYGQSGPIANFHPNGWGVHFWYIRPNRLFIRFIKRKGRRSTPPVVYRRLRPGRWAYIGASYSKRTGVASLYVNSRRVKKKYIGKFRLATNYPIRMGARIGDKRYFKGKLSCFQVFNYVLKPSEIAKRKRFCFRKGEFCLQSRSKFSTYIVCTTAQSIQQPGY